MVRLTELVPAMLTSCVANPTDEKVSAVAEDGTDKEKVPLSPVVVPLAVCPFTMTEMPETPLPEESVTLPVICRSWAEAIKEKSKNNGKPIAWSNFLKFISNQILIVIKKAVRVMCIEDTILKLF
jgi:hypothetical protein